MKIKQVEELVGITRKNIRFYEEQGLLSVERAENGYREYSLKDVKRLQEIRFLRKLFIPIEDMREVFEGKKSLTSCLEYQVEKMEREKKNLTQVQEFCETLLQEKLTLEELDAEACLERMEQLEKEGTNFMNIQKTDVHKKKIRGRIFGSRDHAGPDGRYGGDDPLGKFRGSAAHRVAPVSDCHSGSFCNRYPGGFKSTLK